MTGDLWLSICVVFLLLVLSACFSASETALTASSRARLMRMEKQGNRRARLVLALLESRERMIGALLIGNNIVNIAASAIATGVLLAWFGDVGVLYATIVMSVIVIVFAEILPKTAAINAPEQIGLRVAGPIGWLVRVFGPILMTIEGLVRVVLRPLEKLDRDMMGGLLDLRELTVSDVMVHRTEMVTIDADEPAEEIVAAVLSAEFTRIPLWRGSPENIVGIVHAKDLLRAIQNAGGDLARIEISSLMLPPWFVPDIRPLSEQLKAFRRRKTHFALVVDEYGEVEGLVTLEDILEEIVGDISDEHDVPLPGVQPQPDGSVTVDGSVPIRDLNRAMEWNLPDDEATTIAGLVIHEARSIPDVGQIFTFHGFRFRVLGRERNRIASLRITPLVRKPPMLKAG